MKSISIIAAILAVVGLSACSSLAEKTPKQMVQSAVERSLTKDNRFNYEGEMFVKRIPVSESLLTKEQLEIAANNVVLDKKHKALTLKREAYNEDCRYKSKEGLSKKALRELESSCAKREEALDEEINNRSDINLDFINKIEQSLEDNPSLIDVLAGAKIRYKGAIDLPAGLHESHADYSYQGKHERLNIGLPLLLNLNNNTITGDPTTMMRAVMGAIIKDKALIQRLRHEPVRYDFSKMVAKLPLKTAVKAYLLSSNSAYEALPADAFQKLKQDDFGKGIGAKHRIRVVINKQNSILFTETLRHDWLSKFNELVKSEPEAGIKTEGYDVVRAFIDSLKDQDYGQFLEFHDQFFANSYEIFLDDSARMLGGRLMLQPLQVTKGNVMSLEALVRHTGFGKPVFTLKSDGKAISFEDYSVDVVSNFGIFPTVTEDSFDNAASATEAASEVVDATETPSKELEEAISNAKKAASEPASKVVK